MSIFSILISAFKHTKNIYRSLVGINIQTNIIDNKKSEFNRTHWSITKILYLFSDVFLIKLPIYCPTWVPRPIKKIVFGDNSKYIPDDKEYEDGICIMYVNGIMSNEDVIKTNKDELKSIFNRPINVLHNVTDSLISDLIECLIGKTTENLTEASTITLYAVCRNLLNPKIKKLVIICHSQGTIITANVLNNLHKLGLNKKPYLKKLEIYAFANCASKMTYIKDTLPYMEHFANEHDFVAKLGCNCDDDIKKYISIDGKIYITKNKSGHMFNSHYIDILHNDYPDSRLLTYLKN